MARSRSPTTFEVLDRLQQRAGAGDGDLGRLAFDHLVALAADRERRVQNDGVPGHQAIEEMPERGQVLLAGCDRHRLFCSPSRYWPTSFGVMPAARARASQPTPKTR